MTVAPFHPLDGELPASAFWRCRPGHRAYVQPATLAHGQALAAAMRAEDVNEVQATLGMGPLAGLRLSLEHASASGGGAWTLFLGGQVAAVWGVHPLTESVAAVWLLTSTVVERHRRFFAEVSRTEVCRLLERYLVLYNFIDVRYTRALRWAAWAGAQLGAARPWGVEGRPFVPAVWMRRGA